uniref:Uncharacterized protein n=1 Tax=Mycena chlorophos TaxID=658473 RepID=A0ABQ0LLK8_MYCCL|nr:predicted protein [Mycena chlorophos]
MPNEGVRDTTSPHAPLSALANIPRVGCRSWPRSGTGFLTGFRASLRHLPIPDTSFTILSRQATASITLQTTLRE